ncbi:MAG: DUF559 domain-containing protein [Candidatus Latescibacteria bacterium]|nr:DUF559 domain-containing protein [Candidatus Latescibacterota bacterium]
MAMRKNIPALVAIVNRKKDWHIICNQHWYRIPVKSAPDILNNAKYIAFYQTKLFKQEQYSVNYYAKIMNIEICKRCQLLPDEPEHKRANQDYYKILIDDVINLPKPIPSLRWRRITFIPTTLSRLLKAEEINDLWCTSFIEDKLYNALKKEDLAAERQFFVYDADTPYCLDMAIFCKDGNLNVECDGEKYHSDIKTIRKDRQRNNDLTTAGWSILRFSGKEINQDTQKCVKQIKQTVKRLKGINR